MRTVVLTAKLWRELAMTYTPRPVMVETLREQYGMVRIPPEDLLTSFQYSIIDESKYLMFMLRWL